MSCSAGKKVYKFLDKKKRLIEKQSPIYLTQSDFNQGTYLLTQPGYYVLKEDIVFNPNPDADYLPKPEQSQYQTLGFSLGFFAVMAISGKDVYLDLNGHTISASPEFTLQQRFFSIIELADAPFRHNEGPGDFTNGLKSAENVIIRNGTLGLSSHHGVHGNLAKNILLEKLAIKHFEFVGIALNGGSCLAIKNVEIGPNRHDIPVLATYSAARFAKMFAKRVLQKSYSEKLATKLEQLETEMNETFHEVMAGRRVTSSLFRNESGLGDGNIYGVVIKDAGVAVNDFVVSSKAKTENVYLNNVNIHDMKCRVDEIIALSGKGKKGATIDPAGAVFQIDRVTSDGRYSGTALSDLQLELVNLGKSTINSEIVAWAKSGDDISTLLRKGYKYVCGGDSMHHFNKGAIGYRFDAINNLVLKKSRLDRLGNSGCCGNDVFDGNYTQSFTPAARKGYFGADCTGINISDCTNVKIKKCGLEDLFAKDGDCIGVNVIFKSDVVLEKCEIRYLKAGTLHRGKWRGRNYYGDTIKYWNLKTPNKVPRAIGVRIEKDCFVDLDDVKICKLCSPAKPVKVLKE